MSKILSATCDATGKVTAEGVQVPAAQVLTEGKQASSGILIMEADKVWYVAMSSSDLKTSIDKTAQALQKAADGLTAAGSALDSIVPASGTAVSLAATQMAPLIAQLNQLKEALK